MSFSIDGSKEDGSFGRLVNDYHRSPNCIIKKGEANDRPHLRLFAVKNTEPGTEIDYNYGDLKWPWRNKIRKNFKNVISMKMCHFKQLTLNFLNTVVP